MSAVITASWCLALAGLLLGLAALAVFGRPMVALRAMVDLFVAAGLLRLSADLSWAAIASTVAVIAVRLILTRSLASDIGAAARNAHAS
ncbi:Uncharacterised protein [Mycolicibacterium vanbaalenii]|uniref:DUF1622 domain-containing protein n=1 Tax=Mycolicibacterium vanbaalenii TaxID=110539 RepID=A0A5S9P4N2_MYCVN|nr:hypothetical protein [Mycolicibacterium vanbaalenii]CAA0098355.1 Uncharacterised protein [Mycolicibacterium vanbaalenii]